MSDSIHDRVIDLLTDAESALEEVREGDTDLEDTALADLASDAATLLDTADSADLLAALGLGELPDGSEPETIPEAIAGGDAEDLADLRAFVKLAKLATHDPDSEGSEPSLEDLDEALTARDAGASEPDESASGAAKSQRDTESEDADEDEGVAASVTDAVGDAVEGATDAGDDAELGDQLESAVRSSFDGFDEGIRNVREQLEEMRDEDSSADASSPDANDGDGETADDDGMLRSLGPSGSKARGTMYSTMAPRPSDRADMRTSTRHSTMPDRR